MFVGWNPAGGLFEDNVKVEVGTVGERASRKTGSAVLGPLSGTPQDALGTEVQMREGQKTPPTHPLLGPQVCLICERPPVIEGLPATAEHKWTEKCVNYCQDGCVRGFEHWTYLKNYLSIEESKGKPFSNGFPPFKRKQIARWRNISGDIYCI